MKELIDIPLLEMELESDFECFVWCGVVANTTTNQQTQARSFKLNLKSLVKTLTIECCSCKEKVINILDKFMEDNQCLLIMENFSIIKSITRKL